MHVHARKDPGSSLHTSASASALTAVVFNTMRYAVHDGPGIRTVVFFKGCPLRCAWCHNPEGQAPGVALLYRDDRCIRCGDCLDVCPHGTEQKSTGEFGPVRSLCEVCGDCVQVCVAGARALVGEKTEVLPLLHEILKDRAFFDQSGGGVTFSGGEPLVYPEFIRALGEACRAHGIHTAIETSASAPWDSVRLVMDVIDLFLVDMKSMDEDEHRRYTGAGNARILENIERLSAASKQVIARFPVVPGINNGDRNVQATIEFLLSRTSIREVHLLPFHHFGGEKSARIGRENTMPSEAPSSGVELENIAEQFSRRGFQVLTGG